MALFTSILYSFTKVPFHPLTRAKLILQAQNDLIQYGSLPPSPSFLPSLSPSPSSSPSYSYGTFGILSYILKNEGVKALWRGIDARLIRNGTTTFFEEQLHPALTAKFISPPNEKKDGKFVAFIKDTFAFGLQGMIFLLVGTPFEYANIRLATDFNHQYTGLLDVLRKTLFNTDNNGNLGLMGIPSGLLLLYTGVTASALHYFAFHGIKNLITYIFNFQPTDFRYFYAAGTGVLLGTILTFPLDTIRCRMVVAAMHGIQGHSGVLETAQEIVEREGIQALYRGLTPSLLSILGGWLSFPLSMAGFAFFLKIAFS